MEQLAFLNVQMVFTMMEHWFARNVQLSV